MTNKRKSRLKTYREYNINSLIIFTVIYVIILGYWWLEKVTDPGKYTDKQFIFHTIIYLILCAFFAIEHLYILVMRNNAFKYGDMAEGRVQAIKSHKTLIHGRNGDYYNQEWDLTVEYKYKGEICFATFGKYARFDNPGKYISAGDKCNVYIYRRKAYLQDLYKREVIKTENDKKFENIQSGKYDNTPLNQLLKYSISDIPFLNKKDKKDAVKERQLFSLVRSKSYLIVEPLYFHNIRKGYILLVEVYISSLISYNEMDFTLRVTLGRYLKKYEKDDTILDEQILKKDIEKIVKSNIRGSTIQARIKKVEIALLIDYEIKSVDEKDANSRQKSQLEAKVLSGEYNSAKFEEIKYCSASEIIKLKKAEFDKVYSEREIFSQIKSSEFILLPSIILLYPEIKLIYVDIFIISKDFYCEKDFGLYESVQNYISKLSNELVQYEENFLKENIRQIIVNTIRNIDSHIEILDIVIEIKKYSEI